jgi:hypothetical protein
MYIEGYASPETVPLMVLVLNRLMVEDPVAWLKNAYRLADIHYAWR